MPKYSVAYLDTDNAILNPLYEDIDTVENAVKLAQLAIADNYFNRYIVAIFPPNEDLEVGSDEYNQIKELAKKYKSDGNYSFLLKPVDTRVNVNIKVANKDGR